MALPNRARKMKSGEEALSNLTDSRGDEKFPEIEVSLFLFVLKKPFLYKTSDLNKHPLFRLFRLFRNSNS